MFQVKIEEEIVISCLKSSVSSGAAEMIQFINDSEDSPIEYSEPSNPDLAPASTLTMRSQLSDQPEGGPMSTGCIDHHNPRQLSSPVRPEKLETGSANVAEFLISNPNSATTDLALTSTPNMRPPRSNQSVGGIMSTESDDRNHRQSRHPFSLPPVTTSAIYVEGRSGIVPELQNVVSTFNVHCKLDLLKMVTMARNAEYNPKRFAALIMRIKDPRTTALIFSTGNVVCTGAKSAEYSRLAARKFARIIQKVGYPQATFSKFKIQNLVGSTDAKFTIRLEAFSHHHYKHCSYEPEIFPGLKYDMIKPKVVLLIFKSGKVVITGAKEQSQITEAFENIYPSLLCFKK